MRIRLPNLQDDDKEAIKLRSEGIKLRSEGLPAGWEDIKQALYSQGLPYVSKVIRSKLISRHYDDLLVGHFGREKTRKLIVRKYYWLTL